MSNTPNYDAKVKVILDGLVPGERVDRLTGEKWMMTEEEIGWYKKFNVPPSKQSPIIRMKILTGFVVGLDVWWNKHPETGKPILSYIHPDSLVKPMPDEEWYANDFSDRNSDVVIDAPVMPQLVELIKRVPALALRQFILPINTIGVVTLGVEDAFMVFICRGRRSYYCYNAYDVEDSIDIVYSRQITRCYSLLRCFRMYDCQYSFESSDCVSSSFLFDCRNCEFCFGATNQRNKKYVWFNEQLSREEYERRLAEVDLSHFSTFETFRQRFKNFVASEAVWPANFNQSCEQATGEYMLRCTRVNHGFWLDKATDSAYYYFNSDGGADTVFVTGAFNPQYVYMSNGIVNSSHSKFCTTISGCDDVEYCYGCNNCEHCFGCVGLRNKKFHIFNKPYAEEEYWKKLDEIKCAMLDRGEYGEFFPTSTSPTGLQFSPTMWFFDVSETEIDQLGVPRLDPRHGGVTTGEQEQPIPTINVSEIPDNIDDVDPSVYIKKPIHDAELDRNFSVIMPEYEIYKSRRLPFPRRHFSARLKALVAFANKPQEENHRCDKCQVSITIGKNSAFPARKVYCTACYLNYLETR